LRYTTYTPTQNARTHAHTHALARTHARTHLALGCGMHDEGGAGLDVLQRGDGLVVGQKHPCDFVAAERLGVVDAIQHRCRVSKLQRQATEARYRGKKLRHATEARNRGKKQR
jgi:hypothetical protein